MDSDPRLALLHEWIKEILGDVPYTLEPASEDASFRRYFRLLSEQGQYIAVDAPPEKESNEAFAKVTHLLEAEGLPVPHIHYSFLDSGYFLLDDFGNTLLLDILDAENADNLYGHALEALTVIQQIPADSLPKYSQELLLQEMELFRQWFLIQLLDVKLSDSSVQVLNSAFTHLKNNALDQPQVFVHRDYHSRNLMKIDTGWPGIIDYQDAVCGPLTYDAVSLLRDCYIQWPSDRVQTWALDYRDRLMEKDIVSHITEETFLKWFDLMGIQRHLKAIGIFARLNLRDKKPGYLKDIPRTLEYIKSVAPKYPETQELAVFIDKKVFL
ncbi:MAG: phosphotransferase [Proteobacteria bacterium]|nr:phosphotransferase [Pseudomonadota bacterium]